MHVTQNSVQQKHCAHEHELIAVSHCLPGGTEDNYEHLQYNRYPGATEYEIRTLVNRPV
jgi:hypothetical protein